MPKRRIEYIAIDVLAPSERNAKGHDAAVIGGSIDRFGFIEPCLLDERTHRLVAGHGRRENLIAKRDAGEAPPEGVIVKAGVWTVPVVRGWASVDDAEAEAAGIALNQATIAGGWDSETLAAMLSDLASSSLGFDGTGFEQANLDDLLHSLDVSSRRRPQADPDEIPVPLPKPVTKPGDLWVMGEHRVLCGDSTNLDDVRRVLDGEPIDFAFTSPPYNVGVDYEDNDDALMNPAYEKLLRAVLENVMTELAPGRFLGWNVGAMPRLRPWVHIALSIDAGFELYRQLIWDKVGVTLPTYYLTRDSGQVRSYRPNPRHEFVWLFVNGKAELGGPGDFDEELLRDDVFRLAPNAATRELWTEAGSTSTVGSAQPRNSSSVGKVHPAPFPVALPQAFIGYLADRGAIVFDPFAGAGSTMIAAHRMGRRGYGVELSPRYCDVIAERYQRVTELLPVLARTGKPVDFLERRARAEKNRKP